MSVKTIIVGFGRIAASNADDPVMGSAYRYATHIQAIRDCSEIEIIGIVDPSEQARDYASTVWGVNNTYSSLEVAYQKSEVIELAVITTPPDCRQEILNKLPNLKGVIVEKPLAMSKSEAELFVSYCCKNNIVGEVNFWRRFVPQFRELKEGKLNKIIGKIQGVTILYGNGIRNNGIHLIDLARFLVGEIGSIQKTIGTEISICGPIHNDCNVSFSGAFENGVPIYAIPVDFKYYRENGLSLIGEKGCLSIMNDGRIMFYNDIRKHGGISNAMEISFDDNKFLHADYDLALLALYKQIVGLLNGKKQSVSSLQNALLNENIIDRILH